jgi:Fic family protein
MILLPPELLDIDEVLLQEIDSEVRSIYRLIVFSERHGATDLLTRYQEAVQHLRMVLSIKNAQQEAHTVAEAQEYLTHLKECLEMIIGEIGEDRSFESAADLFRLFRHIAPEAARRHPNMYRQTLVQFGPCVGAAPAEIAGLVEQLFLVLREIPHPVVRAAYLHHELIRIHPFVDGNGRVSRMAKNWLLMYELYPPIFIYSGADRTEYISGLQESYLAVEQDPFTAHPATRAFFKQEVRRVKASVGFILQRMLKSADEPFGPNDMDATPDSVKHPGPKR